MSYMETHPYNSEPIPDNARLLIVRDRAATQVLESPMRRGWSAQLDFEFFYGSGHNNMWLWLNQIALDQGMPLPNEETEAQEYRKAARDYLIKNRLWMKDVLQTYRRK